MIGVADIVLLSCVAALILSALAAFYYSRRPTFWMLAKRNPDFALLLLKTEGCLIDRLPSVWDQREFVGPFKIRSLDGIRHTVHLPADRREAIQRKVGLILKTTRRAIPATEFQARGLAAPIR